ncbi:MAG: response regulator [Planctomycetota bacterium]
MQVREPVSGPVDVLIVDDEPHLPELVSMLLARFGYRAETVMTGEEVLARLERGPVRLIISDHYLSAGQLSGLDLVREVGRRWEVPFLVVTASFDLDVIDALRNEPAVVRVIRKPFDLLEVVNLVRGAIGGPVDAGGRGSL